MNHVEELEGRLEVETAEVGEADVTDKKDKKVVLTGVKN